MPTGLGGKLHVIMRHNSKSQSALEYVMTYSWAVIVVVVVIALLFAMGFFNPSSNLPQTVITGFVATPVNSVAVSSSQFEIAVGNAKISKVNISGISVLVNGHNFTNFVCSHNGEVQPGGSVFCTIYGTYPQSVTARVYINYSFYNGAFTEQDVSTGTVQTSTTSAPLPSIGSTSFVETGLPSGYAWTVTYNGASESSSTNEITFPPVSSAGYFQYTVSILSNSTGGCTTTYTPSPASGTAASGITTGVSFSHVTYCVTTFTESGLPPSYTWLATYNSVQHSSSTNTITFTTGEGTYAYSINTLANSSSGCTTTYTPSSSPASPIAAGITASVGFSTSTTCTTTFTESGLPSGYKWNVTYNSVLKSSTSTTITYSTTYSGTKPNYAYSINTLSNSTGACTTTYTPSPSSGTLTAGSTQSISFSGSTTCTTTFTESGLPSGYKWNVTYNSVLKSSTSSTITYSTTYTGTQPSYSYTVPTLSNSSAGCTTTYTPSSSPSSPVAVGSLVSVTFTPLTTCTTTFTESGLPGGYTWSVDYGGTTYSASSGSQIQFTTAPGTYSFSVSPVDESPLTSCAATIVEYYVYSPSPSSGSLVAGSPQSITYSLVCP